MGHDRRKRLPVIVLAFLLITPLYTVLQLWLVWNHSSTAVSSFENFSRLVSHATFPTIDFLGPLPDANESFSACLLTMEDDAIGLLQEWIAYHYVVLPLRRLIVANDPRARSSPTEILLRWKDLIDITEWKDKDYFSLMYRSAILNRQFNSTAERLTYLHRYRQRFFYFKCMRQFKRENRSFVALIDSDEFLNVPNPNWKYHSLVVHAAGAQPSSSSFKSWTALQFLRRLRGHLHTSLPCISVPRLLFGARDTPNSDTWYNRHLLESVTMQNTDFVTLRWFWHGLLADTNVNRAGKALVDVSRIPYASLDVEHADPHRPVRDYCSEKDVWIQNIDSALVVHHYIGRFEQWSFRSDPRQARSRERFDFYKGLDSSRDHSITSWLADFVEQVGQVEAKRLLKGVGRIVALPSNISAVLSDEIYSNLVLSNVTDANVTRLT